MFANKIVLITGGGAGIGAVTAINFAKHGAALAVVDKNEANLKKIVQNCANMKVNIQTIKADVAKDEEVKTVIQQTINKYSKIDVLINNAGIFEYTNILKNDILDIYDNVMKTNLRAVIHVTNLAVPYLKETKGNVINVSSISSMQVKLQDLSVYGISKSGLDYFTRSSALELASLGIRVNSINPGIVDTEMTEAAISAGYPLPSINELSLFGRLTDPKEVADLILYLASDKAKSITGSSFVIDNGFLLK